MTAKPCTPLSAISQRLRLGLEDRQVLRTLSAVSKFGTSDCTQSIEQESIEQEVRQHSARSCQCLVVRNSVCILHLNDNASASASYDDQLSIKIDKRVV